MKAMTGLKSIAATAPSTDFLGDTARKSGVFPNSVPKLYAIASAPQIKNNTPKVSSVLNKGSSAIDTSLIIIKGNNR